MRHSFPSRYGQCMCRWCSQYVNGATPECPMTQEMREALRDFAKQYGRSWKTELRNAWMRGVDVGSALQQVRNVIGPSGLDRIRTSMLENM